jgi:hypothetical protein
MDRIRQEDDIDFTSPFQKRAQENISERSGTGLGAPSLEQAAQMSAMEQEHSTWRTLF